MEAVGGVFAAVSGTYESRVLYTVLIITTAQLRKGNSTANLEEGARVVVSLSRIGGPASIAIHGDPQGLLSERRGR